MAAEVSSVMRLLTRHDKDDSGGEGNHGGGDLVTRDFLGGCCGGGDGKELSLGLGAPTALGVADLNMSPLCSSGFPPPPRPRGLLEEPRLAAALDLRLRPSVPPPTPEYQSVCTLEKVRSALERAQRESSLRNPPPPPAAAAAAAAAFPGLASPASSSTTTTSAKRPRGAAREEEGERESTSTSSSSSVVMQGGEDGGGAAAMAAAGCPSCLLYVLIARADPRCPRCNSAVPLPPLSGKRPRIDLNAAEPAPAATPLKTVNFF